MKLVSKGTARSVNFAFQPQTLKNIWNIQVLSNAYIFQYSTELADTLVGSSCFGFTRNNAVAPPFAFYVIVKACPWRQLIRKEEKPYQSAN